MNLIGRKFGRLEVIANANNKGYVVCKCDCGNICTIRADCLTRKKHQVSCGCYRREIARITGSRVIHQNSKGRLEKIAKYGTNISAILKDTPNANNKSGYKGVWYNAARGVYESYISFGGKKHNLGCYRNLQDAVKARKVAEDRYFKPIIDAIIQENAQRIGA